MNYCRLFGDPKASYCHFLQARTSSTTSGVSPVATCSQEPLAAVGFPKANDCLDLPRKWEILFKSGT